MSKRSFRGGYILSQTRIQHCRPCWHFIAKHLAVINYSFLRKIPELISRKNMQLKQRGGGVTDVKNCLAKSDILSLEY